MSIFETMIRLLTPYDCSFCGQEGLLWCDNCRRLLLSRLPSRCYLCSIPTDNFSVCSSCNNLTHLKNAWVACVYDRAAKKLIGEMKLSSHRQAAYIIAKQLHECLPNFNVDYICPVPTAKNRIRSRGFDHTVLIAKQLARLRSIKYLNLLERRGSNKQIGSSRKERFEQARHSYKIKKHLSSQEKVLLIDDVITTGATITQAAALIKQAGASTIYAASFAQAA